MKGQIFLLLLLFGTCLLCIVTTAATDKEETDEISKGDEEEPTEEDQGDEHKALDEQEDQEEDYDSDVYDSESEEERPTLVGRVMVFVANLIWNVTFTLASWITRILMTVIVPNFAEIQGFLVYWIDVLTSRRNRLILLMASTSFKMIVFVAPMVHKLHPLPLPEALINSANLQPDQDYLTELKNKELKNPQNNP